MKKESKDIKKTNEYLSKKSEELKRELTKSNRLTFILAKNDSSPTDIVKESFDEVIECNLKDKKLPVAVFINSDIIRWWEKWIYWLKDILWTDMQKEKERKLIEIISKGPWYIVLFTIFILPTIAYFLLSLIFFWIPNLYNTILKKSKKTRCVILKNSHLISIEDFEEKLRNWTDWWRKKKRKFFLIVQIDKEKKDYIENISEEYHFIQINFYIEVKEIEINNNFKDNLENNKTENNMKSDLSKIMYRDYINLLKNNKEIEEDTLWILIHALTNDYFKEGIDHIKKFFKDYRELDVFITLQDYIIYFVLKQDLDINEILGTHSSFFFRHYSKIYKKIEDELRGDKVFNFTSTFYSYIKDVKEKNYKPDCYCTDKVAWKINDYSDLYEKLISSGNETDLINCLNDKLKLVPYTYTIKYPDNVRSIEKKYPDEIASIVKIWSNNHKDNNLDIVRDFRNFFKIIEIYDFILEKIYDEVEMRDFFLYLLNNDLKMQNLSVNRSYEIEDSKKKLIDDFFKSFEKLLLKNKSRNNDLFDSFLYRISSKIMYIYTFMQFYNINKTVADRTIKEFLSEYKYKMVLKIHKNILADREEIEIRINFENDFLIEIWAPTKNIPQLGMKREDRKKRIDRQEESHVLKRWGQLGSELFLINTTTIEANEPEDSSIDWMKDLDWFKDL